MRLGSLGACLAVEAALALAPGLRADEWLSPAFIQAQQMMSDARVRYGLPPLPRVRTLDGCAGYANRERAAVDEAQARLAEVSRTIAQLDDAGRAYLQDHTSPAERSSLAALMRTVGLAQNEALARYRELEARRADLSREAARLQLRLAELGGDALQLRESRELMKAGAEHLRGLIQEADSRLAAQGAVLAEARSLLDSIAKERNRKRQAYWTALGGGFARLGVGTPRDFLPQITPQAPTTMRRVQDVSLEPMLALPAAAPAAAAPYATAAACVLPLAAAAEPAAPAAPPLGLAEAVNAWSQSARAADDAQREADRLCDAVADGQASVAERTAEIARLRGANAGLQSDVARMAEELNDRAARLVDVHRDTAARLGEAVGQFAEELFWETANKGLEGALHAGGLTYAGQLSAHFIWLVKSYDRFLGGDLPRALEFMSSQSSKVDMETYQRLTHLTEIYVADRERSMVMVQVESDTTALVKEFKDLGNEEVLSLRPKGDLDQFLRDAVNSSLKPLYD